MKKRFYVLLGALIVALLIVDYINLPTYIGLEMFRMNWDIWIGLLSISVVIALYFITFKKLDEQKIRREKNKKDISILLVTECLNECVKYIEYITQEVIEKYILPKTGFNCTIKDQPIIRNLQSAPFLNENIVMDFAKDGQLTKDQIEGYLEVKALYSQYITMRIDFYDAPQMFAQIKQDLLLAIDRERKKY